MAQFLSRIFLAGLAVALIAGAALRPRERRRVRRRAPQLGSDHLLTGDGVRLPLASWLPQGAPSAVLLGVHGYGDYRQAFELAGRWLATRGIAVYAYDQRGFGETRMRGRWPGAEALIDDLADAAVALRTAHPELPLAVLGESMGGAVALAGLDGCRVSGVDRLILAAPAVRGGVQLRQVHDLALRLGALALPWLRVELRRGGRPWLDPEESRRLAEDPLILRRLSVGTCDDLIELANRATVVTPARLPPTLLLYGELDSTIPRAGIDDLALSLGARCTLRVFPERHHLLLHETNADEVLDECLRWLAAAAHIRANSRPVPACSASPTPAHS
jgi:alpha-beta hydrolase superfamily lysophospholipase